MCFTLSLFLLQGMFRDLFINYYSRIMNSSKDFETVSKTFDMEYAKLTILLDSLDVNEVEESLHYGEGENSLCD